MPGCHPRATTIVVLTVAATAPLTAQTPRSSAPEWNDARVSELLVRAREVRQSAAVDDAMRSYQAEARGRVYFFVDRPDRAEHMLVKGDQVALEVFWRAPRDARQRIVGRRDERVLPTAIRYHLDHLTVVQDDFGDYIRLGDGDEVAEVLHPVGPGSGGTYDFQLVDSLRLTYGQVGTEIRVYEIRVRPKRMDRPGFVGTVFLDLATASIVRMNFSFTPSSYVDPYLDYIRISLDNALWLGRFWLPYRQEVELRREMPLLDFSAGSVIRSKFEIRDYDFNVDLDDGLFRARSVLAVSPAQREAFPFEEGLFDEIDAEGLSTSTTMEEVQQQVREVVQDEVLSGLSPIRLHLDGLSDFARYNRAEGIYLGGGLTFRPWGDARLRTTGGYAFHRKRPEAALTLTDLGRGRPSSVRLYWERLSDMGGNPGATPLVNTMTAASGEQDFLDPYFRSGGSVTLGSPAGTSLTGRWERHRSAADVVSDDADSGFRPVQPVHEGDLVAASLGRAFGLPGDGVAHATGTAGRLGSHNLLAIEADSEWRLGATGESWHARFAAEGGVTNPDAPVQAMYLIGGRHTMPGQDYRAWLGNGYWLARAEGTVPVRPPYVGIRAFGVVGATYLGPVDLPAGWSAVDSNGLRGSVGLGLSIGWDSAYLDLAHGVRGGGWEAVFSVSERFAGWM